MADGSYDAGSSPANSGGSSRSGPDRATVKFALEDRAEDLFRQAWGDPEKSAGKDWRSKESSARSMVMRGAKRGQWFDHKAALSGDILDFFAVELCGLGKANDDFPRVLREAAAYCGLSDGAGPDLDAMRARKAAQDAEGAKQAAREAKSKAALVKALQARAEPAPDSPAAAYLASRGITDLPQDGIAFLPAIGATKGIAGGDMAACVVWASNSRGQPMGGQRILLNADGSRPCDLDVSKPTFGTAGGYPARFSARTEGGPLCIAEGPESALSVWLATGFETWAILGVSNWLTAPIPTGRKVILCPDRDLPEGTHPKDSDEARKLESAARAFNKAVLHHAARGCDLHIAEAPEPVGSKSDLNDTLQRAGLQAVRDAIAGATPYIAAIPCEPARAPAPLPKAAQLENGRKVDMLQALRECAPDDALPVAVAVAHKLQTRAPLIYTPQDVATLISTAAPSITAPQLAQIADRVKWLQSKRRADTMRRTALLPETFAAHDVRQVQNLTEIDVTGWRGVMAVKAPMATGKTQLIGWPFVQDAKANGLSIMAIAHRVTLISELSSRLGLPDYRALENGQLAEKNGCAVCLPSTTRGDIAEALPAPECLFIDEIAQVLQFLAEPMCASGMADNRGVYNRLVQLVRDARAVVVADADLDARTIAFLEKARPNERFTIVEVEAQPTGKRALVTSDTGKVLDAVTIELLGGGKVWLACEGARKAAAFAAHFEATGAKVICITADTKLDPAPARFLENPEAESLEYDLVISSPAISSGLSIEHKGSPHFTLGAYIGAGTAIRPEDAKQQLGRVRYLTRFVIGLDYSNLSGGQTVSAYRAGAIGAAQIENLDLEWTDFDTYSAGVMAQAANAKADFAAGLWWILEAAGWQLERPKNPEDQSQRGVVKEITKAAREQRCSDILSADVVDSHQAGLLENMARNSVQEIRRTAHQIRTALGKLDITADDVGFWDEERGRSKIARYEDLIGADVTLPPDSEILSARKFRTARRRLFEILFDGIDLTSPLSQSNLDTILDRVMTRPAIYATAGIVGDKYRAQYRGKTGETIAPNRPKQAGREVKKILERCGLSVSTKRARIVPKPFSIDTKGESFGTADNREYITTVTPESMAYMAAILDRRDGFEIDEALARAAMFEVVDASSASLNATETWGLNAGENCEAFLKAGKDQAAQVARIPTNYSVSDVEPVSHSKRRLVVISKAETIDSTLMAQFIEARQQVRAWWRNIDKGRSIKAVAFA
jgi:hypothetical protein